LLLIGLAVVVVIGVIAGLTLAWRRHEPTPTLSGPGPTDAATPAALPLDGTKPVSVAAPWWGWSLVDLRTGQTWGSATENEVNRSASMTKAWLAALYLREHPDPGPEWLERLSAMIRDSDNDAADIVHRELGADGPVTAAMGTVCGVDGVRVESEGSNPWRGWAWMHTSPRQSAQLGACIANGDVAEPRWTQWLLDQMRHVRGEGDFGIQSAFPKQQRSDIAIKNGWSEHDGQWVVNCLAIGEEWSLAVESRTQSFEDGSQICVSVTEQLLR
jgi:hypothetical protein